MQSSNRGFRPAVRALAPLAPMAPLAPLAPLALALLLATGCIGPQAGHRDGYEAPTGPTPPVVTNVRGFVRDAASRQPVVGATVTFEGTSSTTRSDGNYTLERIQMRAGVLSVIQEGYLPFSSTLALNGGERQIDVLLTRAPSADR